MKIYIGGDSGYDTHYAEIGNKHGSTQIYARVPEDKLSQDMSELSRKLRNGKTDLE